MGEINYTVGTGFFESPHPLSPENPPPIPGFAEIWMRQIAKADPQPKEIVAIGVGGCAPPYRHPIQSITLGGNLGYIGGTRHHLGGWSAGAIALSMVAYNNGTDFIYVEQDCLCFGDWVRTLYRDSELLQVAFGRSIRMAAAQALFLVKHDYIPQFVCDYLTLPRDSLEFVPESKFAKLAATKPDKWGRFSFGYDRDRPFDVSQKAFYLQHLTMQELDEVRGAGLIS